MRYSLAPHEQDLTQQICSSAGVLNFQRFASINFNHMSVAFRWTFGRQTEKGA